MDTLKRLRRLSAVVFLSGVIVSCATLAPDTVPLRLDGSPDSGGSLVSASELFLKPAAEWNDLLFWASPDLLASKIDTGNLIDSGYAPWREKRLGTLRDVEAIRVVFDTRLLPADSPVDRQSGLLLLPAARKGRTQVLDWIIWTKGTELVRSEAPSAYRGFEASLAGMLAGLGFAVWMPDYAGFGESGGTQTYCVPDSQALSAADGLRAARKVLERSGDAYAESGNLALLGYSQGGLAAMATARHITEHIDLFPGLSLKAVWSLGAPLDLMLGSRTPTESDTVLSRPEYTVYLVLGWARAYPDLIKPDSILNPEIVLKVAPIFDGKRDNDILHVEIAKAVGKKKGEVTFSDLFLPSYLEAIRTNPESVAYYRLQNEARLDRWIPPRGTSLVLAASMKDKVVSPMNSLSSRDWILAHESEASVTFHELKSKDHATAGAEALLWAILSLDTAKTPAAR